MSPILLECPFPIRTKRLVIRPVQAGDGPQLNECVRESFEQFNRWLPWAQTIPSLDESEEFARVSYADFLLRKAFHLGVFHGDRLVGMCGFNHIDWHIPSAAIGYWCRLSEQGKGYTQEAVKALTFYGFQQIGFRRIEIKCEEENKASIAVAEKCGYHLECHQKGVLSFPGRSDLLASRVYVLYGPRVELLDSYRFDECL